MKILMVCLGNICRSPLAEAVLRKKVRDAGLNWFIDSAGTNGFHTGEAPHHFTQKVAKANHIDISNLRARQFTALDCELFDKIYVMAADVLEEVKEIAGKQFNPGMTDYFFDPWYGGYDGFEKVYQLIDETCNAILKSYFTALKTTQAQL